MVNLEQNVMFIIYSHDRNNKHSKLATLLVDLTNVEVEIAKIVCTV